MPFTSENALTGTQFKPGQSGNPKGLPKGTLQIDTWINKLLNDEKFTTMVREGIELKEYKGAPIKAIIKAQIILAINGDTKAADMLFKHGAPKKQEIDITSNGEQIGATDPATAAAFAEFLKKKK